MSEDINGNQEVVHDAATEDGYECNGFSASPEKEDGKDEAEATEVHVGGSGPSACSSSTGEDKATVPDANAQAAAQPPSADASSPPDQHTSRRRTRAASTSRDPREFPRSGSTSRDPRTRPQIARTASATSAGSNAMSEANAAASTANPGGARGTAEAATSPMEGNRRRRRGRTASATSATSANEGAPPRQRRRLGSRGSGDQAATEANSTGAGPQRTNRPNRGRGLRRRLLEVLRGELEDSDNEEEDGTREADADEGEDAEAEDGEGEEEEGTDDDDDDEEVAIGALGDHVMVIEGAEDAASDVSDMFSEANSGELRERLASGDAMAQTLWRSTVFRGPEELTGECAFAVAKWMESGKVPKESLDNEMILCLVRVLERSYAMFEEEDDMVVVFQAALSLTDSPYCVNLMLERGVLRALVRGLKSIAHLFLELAEGKEWFETDKLMEVYKAFQKLWITCLSRPSDDIIRKQAVNIMFSALSKWLRSVPLEDLWMGEEDIFVFWVLISLWPDYLRHIDSASEEGNRFKEICNWVLWPNDPVVEADYRLIGHLDLETGRDCSLKFLLTDEFKWVLTPATKQRYLQYRVSEYADQMYGVIDEEAQPPPPPPPSREASSEEHVDENGVVWSERPGDEFAVAMQPPHDSRSVNNVETPVEEEATEASTQVTDGTLPVQRGGGDAGDNERSGSGQATPRLRNGLVLVVHRETPLQDLCRQLGVSGYGTKDVNLLSGITVHFDGGNEEGVDEGGPWREAIPLAFTELFDVRHGLFDLVEEGSVRSIEPRACAPRLVPDYEAQFELCGVLIAMALVYQAYSPAHFSRCFLKHLLKQPRGQGDIASLDDRVKTINAAGEEDFEYLCITFSVDDPNSGTTYELMPGGADVTVTAATRDTYITLLSEYMWNGRFDQIAQHVHKGMERVITAEIWEHFSQMVNPDELDVLLAGHGIDIEDWREHTEYSGYEESDNIIQWFWEAVQEFTAQEREDLWTFISGSKGVPPGGFGHLTNAAGEAIRFTIAKVTSSTEHLPVAHTCGYQLDLAQYSSAEELRKKIRQAMSHRQGFGLA